MAKVRMDCSIKYFLFSIFVPIGIYSARELVRRIRLVTLQNLQEAIFSHVPNARKLPLPYWFEYARFQYEQPDDKNKWPLSIAALTFSLISFLGFFSILLIPVTKDASQLNIIIDPDIILNNVILSPIDAIAGGKTDVKLYRMQTLAVSGAAFVGAYLWTLIYLGRRVTNYDLTPYSFLRSTFQIALCLFCCDSTSAFIRSFA